MSAQYYTSCQNPSYNSSLCLKSYSQSIQLMDPRTIRYRDDSSSLAPGEIKAHKCLTTVVLQIKIKLESESSQNNFTNRGNTHAQAQTHMHIHTL